MAYLFSTVFCDLALLLGLVDARRYDRSQLQALVEVLRLDLEASGSDIRSLLNSVID